MTHSEAVATRTPTRREADVLRWLAATIQAHGFPPTCREVSEHFGWNTPTTAFLHFTALERKGLLRREGRRPRALALTPAGQRALAKRSA